MKTILTNLFIFGGLALMAGGFAGYSVPLACIVVGAILFAIGLAAFTYRVL